VLTIHLSFLFKNSLSYFLQRPSRESIRLFYRSIGSIHFHANGLFEFAETDLIIVEFIHLYHLVFKVFEWFRTFLFHLLYHEIPQKVSDVEGWRFVQQPLLIFTNILHVKNKSQRQSTIYVVRLLICREAQLMGFSAESALEKPAFLLLKNH